MAGLGTGAPIVKLYHEKSIILPDVSRVLACLYEKDIKFQTHTTSSFKGLLRLQASSHVPVPFDDGLTFLEESREICRYIAETYEHQGYPFLLGKDSLERASIEQWLHHEEHNFNPPSRSLFCHLAFPLAEEDDDIDLQKRKLEEVLEVYEQRLGDSEFLAGNKFTLADLVHLPNSHYITGSDKFAYLYDSRKNVQRWWNDISTRKSWQNVLKDIQVVEQQRKKEEFEKQQQRQWLRERPPTTRRKIRLDSQRQTSTKPQTVLVPPPVGIISTSPTASQAEKPLPTGTSPGETPLSSPTTRKSSTVQSKHTTIFTTQRETPAAPAQSTPRLPGYPHIPDQSTSNPFSPATPPTIAENPSRTGADKPKIRGVSLPSEATEIDLPANSKRSSSNEVSHNLRVFKFYEASNRTDEAEPCIDPTPQKPSDMLDRISGTDEPSNATDHVKTSPTSAKEDSGAAGFWTDNTATNADTLDKKSVRYTERTLQRPDETIYSRSTDHRATYTSPEKHGSTETHQKLQTEEWHGTAAGLSNLKGKTDYSMPTQQVKPGKDVQHSSSQDSEQVSTHPLAQEPVSTDRQLVQGAEMTPRTLYPDQKRDVSSMLWQKTADVRGIAEEDKASSDHRDAVTPPYARKHVDESKIVSADHRKEASLPMRVKDEDTQAIPFQTAYDDVLDIAQEARETASAPRQRKDEDAYDTSPQTTASPLKKRYSGDEDITKQSKQAASRPRQMAAQDIRDNFEETKAGDPRSTRERPSDTWRASAPLPRHEIDDAYRITAQSGERYHGTRGTIEEAEDTTSMPGQMAGEDAKERLEETKFAESASSQAQPLYYHRTDAPSRKQEATEDRPGATSALERRYADARDTTKHSRDTTLPSKIVGEDTEDTSEEAEAEARNSALFRAQPQDVRRVPTTPSKQAAEDALSVSRSSPKRYPRAEETSNQSRDAASKPTHIAAQDARNVFRESKVADSTPSIEQPSDARAAVSFQKQEIPDARNTSASFQKTYPDDKGATKKSKVTFEETASPDSASSRVQPSDSRRDYAPTWKKEAMVAPRATSPFKKRDSDVEDTAKRSDGAPKPRQMVGQDTQGTYEETKVSDFGLPRERSSDTWQATNTPTEKVATEDGPGGTPLYERNAPSDEDTTTGPRGTASAPRRATDGDAIGAFQESKPADSVSSREQPLSARQPVVSPSKQETDDSLSKISAFHKTRPIVEDSTRPAVDTVFGPRQVGAEDTKDITEETKVPDAASSVRARPTFTPRTARPLSEQAEVEEDARDKDRERKDTFSAPKKMVSRDAEDLYGEKKTPDSASTEQFFDNLQTSSPLKQEADEFSHGATRGARESLVDEAKHSQGVKGASKKSEVTFEETESPDSASSRVHPSDSQRDYAPSWKKEATEAPRVTSPFKKRHTDVEDTSKHSRDNAFEPRQMMGQDTQGTYEETKASDFGLPREQSLDTWQATNNPTKKVATEDSPGGTPPSERNAPSDEDTTTGPRSTYSAPRLTSVGDASGPFQESKPADSVSSREQPLSAGQPPAVTPSGQETEDSHSKISAFHKTRPFIEDSSRQDVDTVFGPRKIGAEDAKDSTEETKVADSASSVRARPTYTPRTARPLSEQAEVEEDAQHKDREGRETFSAPKKMVSRYAEDTYGQRKTPHSAPTEQFLDNLETSSPSKQAAAEDSRGATRGAKESLVDETKHSRGVKGASKKPVGTFEETKDPGSTLSTAQPVSAQDAQRTGRLSRTPTADQWKDAPRQLQSNLQEEVKSSSAHQKGLGSSPSQSEAGDDNQTIMGEKVFSSEQLRKMPKESRSATSKPQPADSRSPTKVERTPSVYQEDHPVVPDSREQPQTLPTAVRADGSTPKRKQTPVIPSTSEEKSTPPTPPRAKAHDDYTTGEPVKRDTVDDPKGAPLLSGQEPTSQVQRATELTPDGDMSSKPSTIDKWRLTSAPIQGVTPNSGDDALGVSSIDQKPTSMSQQSLPSARGANEMVKREQGMVPTAPAGAQTPDVQHAPPSFGGTDMAERNGSPVQMQAPTQHARPTSVPTRRATPDARDTGDNEFANTSDAQRWKALKTKHDSAMIDEDVPDASLLTHDATGDNKTTWHADEAKVSDTLPGSTASPVNVRPTSGDKLVERLAPDQEAKPTESTQAETSFDAPGDSVSTQGVTGDALDKTKIAKPSSTEGMRPTVGSASTLEAQLAEHKIAPADKKSARAAEPQSSVETKKEDTSVSAADQTKKPETIFRQEARPSTPITKLVPSSNAYHDTRKMQQATLDNLPTDDSPTPHVPSYEQVSHTPQTIPSERDMPRAPGTSDSPISNTQIASAKFQEAIPDNYRPDELTVSSVSSEKGSYAGSSTDLHEGPSHDPHGAADDKDMTKYPSKQAPVLEYRPDTSADSYVRPTSGDDPGISPGQGAESPTAAQAKKSADRHNEVFPAEKKFALSDQDSVHSVQQPSAAETRKGETIVAPAEQTLPRNIGQQHTRDMREAPTSDFVPAEDIPSDAQSGRPDKVALAEQKFASSDQDTQLTSSVEPRNEEIRNSTRSAQPLFSAEDDQTKDPQTTIGQQDMVPTPGTSKSPSSGKFQEVAPDDHRTVESLPNQRQISRAKPSFVLSEGPTHDSHSDLDKNTTKLPSSQPQSSDPTQNRSDEPPTKNLPSQLPKQHEETQALPPVVGPYDSKPSQDVTSDTLGKSKSLKPSSIDQEAMGSALTPDIHLGRAPGEVAPSEQKLLLKDQDSARPTQKSSSSEPTKEQSTVTAPSEARASPTIFRQQDISLAQTKMKDPSSGSQYIPQRLQEITPENQRTTGSIPRQKQVPHFEHISKPNDGPTPDPHGAFVEEPMAHTTGPTPHAQYYMAPSGLSPDEEKPDISDKDSDHHTQLRYSAGSRKEEGDVDASGQTIMPAARTGKSSGEVLEVVPDTHRSSELTKPLIPSRKQDSHEGPNPDAHRAVADENKQPPLVSQARTLESGRNSAPFSDDVIPTSGDEPVEGLTNEHEKPEAFQASLPPEALNDFIHPKSVSAGAFGEIGPLKATGEVTPADQSMAPSEPLPVVESRKESTGTEAEESKVYQPVTGQKDIRHASDISESVLDDDRDKESASREEQVSHDQIASEPREGSPPDVHGVSLDKKTTPPSSQAQSSDPKRDALPKSVDVNPSSREQSTTKSLLGHGLTRSPPLHESLVYPESNEDVPESFKPPSANQEVTSPKVVPASAPDTIDPDGQNFPLPVQDSGRSAQRPFSIEPIKQKGIVASSNQTNEARTIIGQQGVTLSTDKENTPFDLEATELAKPPNEDQEQVHVASAYEQREGPTTDAHGAVDEKVPHPSIQAEKSDIVPDSAPISGDTHRTSVDGPTTGSHDSEAQPPTGTPIVPALFLEKKESPTPSSTDQDLLTPMTSPTPAPEAPQDQDITTSQLSPSVVSRKDVADQANVAHAGLREPASSDSTRPSEKIQESGPDAAYLAKSEKSLLPMKGADPVQPPYEASLDLSSNEKTTMIKGDQANTISNVSLSASQTVDQLENSAVKGPLSEEPVSSFSQKNLERTSPEEKSKQHQQIDQSSTRSSKDDIIEARGTANPNILTRSGDIQQLPLKESMQEARSTNQQQFGKQIQENEVHDNGSDRPEEIRPDSAPISGDARRTSGDRPATSSLRDSQEQPPAGTLNVPAVFLEKIESRRPPSIDQELMTSKTSTAPTPDAPQDQYSTRSPQLSPSVVSRKDVANADQTNVSEAGLREPATSDVTRPSEKTQAFSPDEYLTKSEKPLPPMKDSDPVQTPHEDSFDLSSDDKPTMIKGEQASTISNVSLSASQPVGQSENSGVKGPLSEDLVSSFSKNYERTLPEEKLNQQQQTDKSSTRSSKDNSIEASGTASPNILTTSGDIQPSLKESMQAAQGSRNQQQAGQAVFQSMQENIKKIEETEARDNGYDEPKDIRPDLTPISGDARRTSDDAPASDSLAEPPAGTLNVPTVFLENVGSPRPPSIDQKPITPTTSPAPAPDAPQDQDSTQSSQLSPSVVSRKDVANAYQTNVPQAGLREPASSDATRPSEEIQKLSPDASLTKSAKPLPMTGANPVQPPHEASFDLPSNGKPTMIKGDQANTISNVSLSSSQAVGQSENSAVKGPLSRDLESPFSQKTLGTSPKEKPNQQQQTDQSNTISSKNDSIVEARGATDPDISTSGVIQPSPLKGSMQVAEGSIDQGPADEAVFESTVDDEKQFEETKARVIGPDELYETNPQQSLNQNNKGPSQMDALQQPEERVPAVQPRRNDTNISSKPTKEAPGGIQEDKKSDSSSRSSEESEQQVQTEGRTQGGETKALASKAELPEQRDLPLRNKGSTSQPEAETLNKPEEQSSSSIQSIGTDSSKLDDSGGDVKPADSDDNPPSP